MRSDLFGLEGDAPAEKISDRRAVELIFAFVGPVGSGVTKSAQVLSEVLDKEYGYEVFKPIKMSDIIREEAPRVGFGPHKGEDLSERTVHLQEVGNELRRRYGSDYLARKVVEKIASKRHQDGYQVNSQSGNPVPKIFRRAFIIDSLKNDQEYKCLKELYGDLMWTVGVFAPVSVREGRLLKLGYPRKALVPIFERDDGEDIDFGQKVRKIFSESDFFIRNDKSDDGHLRDTIRRYLELIFFTKIHTPLPSESAMYEAESVAARSGCLSRQVGAAIVDERGELIGVGWNDVPRFNGGLYSASTGTNGSDNRCFRWDEPICHNDKKKGEIFGEIWNALKSKKLFKRDISKYDFSKVVSGTRIDSLTEFSRAVHAEMEAILSVARTGSKGLVGATLFCTTFPCHSCARHIVASGIKAVYFIQPYKKSLALELHSDAASDDEEKHGVVHFLQYEGVAPKNILRLFNNHLDRKKNGRLVQFDRITARPIYAPFIDSFTSYEDRIVRELREIENRDNIT
ncbi:anti-phage dCTP deaminase [Zavarzinia sp. CC-PAN008]|uniref:anti-phage dCTP deaminase n=1 Tax=Zavarzinia sp. CC-PAN008 TaxID=3243332 RepID=UPI003F7470D2